jgi:phosphatidylglycerophosphatase A
MKKPEAEMSSKSGRPTRDFIVKVFATGFGFGFSPIAPGTVGALWGVGIYLLLTFLGVGMPIYVAVVVVLVAVSIPICSRAERLFGGKDPGKIVLDEIVSVPITLFLVPMKIPLIAIGFVLNRLFDIVKIPPAQQSQKLRGGLGVVMDDVIAGIQSNLVMHLMVFLYSRLF